MVGHMGDGNFHVVLPYDPKKKEMYKQLRAFNGYIN
jgi:D-lactate dehydrogenase (cytochrome)